MATNHTHTHKITYIHALTHTNTQTHKHTNTGELVATKRLKQAFSQVKYLNSQYTFQNSQSSALVPYCTVYLAVSWLVRIWAGGRLQFSQRCQVLEGKAWSCAWECCWRGECAGRNITHVTRKRAPSFCKRALSFRKRALAIHTKKGLKPRVRVLLAGRMRR